MDNVVLLPHVASGTVRDARGDGGTDAAQPRQLPEVGAAGDAGADAGRRAGLGGRVRASITLNAVAETSYASCGDLSLAYQVFGDGPVELVFVGTFVSHVELTWAMPEFKAFFDQLSTFCRVVVFDKAGVGLSDPVPHVRTLDDRAAEIEAVMDAAGFGKAVLFGMGEGGRPSIVFAATRPERTRALILAGTYPFTSQGWDDVERDPAELRARSLAELGEDYAASTEQLARLQEFGRAVRSGVGQRCGSSASACRRSGRYASSQRSSA